MRHILNVLLLVGALLMLAAADGDPTVLQRLVGVGFEIIAPIAIGLVVYLARRLVKLLESKFEFDLPDKRERQIEKWVREGLAMGEERGERAAKNALGDYTPGRKFEEAGDYVLDMARSRGWVEWTQEWIDKKVDVELGRPKLAGKSARESKEAEATSR